MSYLTPDFLLTTDTAKRLYHQYAESMPIFDYHCHLPEKELLANRPFADIYEMWLKYDHYKWRLMRNYGIDEAYITGSASAYDKFVAYCKVLGTAFGNPLYHWSQMELEQYFDCTLTINEANAPAIWQKANSVIHERALRPSDIIEASHVKVLFTTNEVFDDLSTFAVLKGKHAFSVQPAYRADKIMNIEAEGYLGFLNKLQSLTHSIDSLTALEKALALRLDAFIMVGCKAADIAVQRVTLGTKQQAEEAFALRLAGRSLSQEQVDAFKGYLTAFLMELYANKGLVCELHIGAMRNNNTQMLAALGLDTGFDSIAEDNSIAMLSRLLDGLHHKGALPKTIVFNLNPKMNSEIVTLLGCFQSPEAKGKLQHGAAWWFLDNKAGMEKHLVDLTATGHLATFVGMLTDSRSYLSYARHLYFRRILCAYLGDLVEKGEITDDLSAIGEVIQDISYRNAIQYFNL